MNDSEKKAWEELVVVSDEVIFPKRLGSTTYKFGSGDQFRAILAADAELTRLREEVEHERFRLAACSVAAMSNTPDTVANRLDSNHPCYSASYADVCRAIDREMSLRTIADHIDRCVMCQNQGTTNCSTLDYILRRAGKE